MAIKYEKPNYMDNPDVIRDLEDLVNQLQDQLLDTDDKDEILNQISQTLQSANSYTDISLATSGTPVLKQIYKIEDTELLINDSIIGTIGEETILPLSKFSSEDFQVGDRCVDLNGRHGLVSSLENVTNMETLETTTNVTVTTVAKYTTVVFKENADAFNVREVGYYSSANEEVSLNIDVDEDDFGLVINDLTGVLQLYQFQAETWIYVCDLDVNPLNLFFETKSNQMNYYLNGAWIEFDINFTPINNIYINGEETTTDLDEVIARVVGNNIFNMMYPIGSIYMSTLPNNPSETFGGSWVAWGNGKVPVGVDSAQTEFDTVEKTGGAKTNVLNADNIPAHTHPLSLTSGSTTASGTIGSESLSTSSAGSHSHSPSGSDSNKNRFVTARGATSTSSTYKLGSWSTNGPDIPTNGDTGSGSNDYFSTTTSTTSAGSHSHSIASHNHTFTGTAHSHSISGNTSVNTTTNTAINNIQPYITCYMWKRVA